MVELFMLAVNILLAFISFILYERSSRISSRSLNWPGLLPALFTIVGDIFIAGFLPGANRLSLFFQWISMFCIIYVSLHCSKLIKVKQAYQLQIDNLKLEKEGAETETLKLQLDPHFLFNSLNTLHHLIAQQNHAAREYVQLLSDVYRYVLLNRNRELVLLDEELAFSQQYFDLLSVRYGNAAQFIIGEPDIATDEFLVIPVSIQILVENVFKHNHFSSNEPLLISVILDENYVSVYNKVRETNKNTSLNIGLQNLSERSTKIIGKPLKIASSPLDFMVSVPLLKYK